VDCEEQPAVRGVARARAREALAAMTDEEDKFIKEAAVADPDARPLDGERLARMRPASTADAGDMKRRVRGRPRAQTPKHLVSLRLDPDVVARYRATGPGWQSRINELLREHMPEVWKWRHFRIGALCNQPPKRLPTPTLRADLKWWVAKGNPPYALPAPQVPQSAFAGAGAKP
jgi:uncharacterized protein (DUF4415 family)